MKERFEAMTNKKNNMVAVVIRTFLISWQKCTYHAIEEVAVAQRLKRGLADLAVVAGKASRTSTAVGGSGRRDTEKRGKKWG